MSNFWEKLDKPIFCLAPMADVTDCAFRKIIAKYGKPDVFWTEFVSADGLAHPEARKKLLIDFQYSADEHPIVAQIFGANPSNIREASKLCRELGFDGIDINMGCPDRSIEKQGAGACMIMNHDLAREVIEAAREGGGGLPVSVKTRIGYNKVEFDWLEFLLSLDLPALTVHLRTRKEMSLVPAHWELMPEIVSLRDKISPKTILIGNGDAIDLVDAKKKVKDYGCDGVMLGRAIFGNPWLFSSLGSEYPLKGPDNFLQKISSFSRRRAPKILSENTPSLHEKLRVMIEHTKLFEKMLGEHKNFAIMKKHYKAYVNGFDGAKELRVKLMEAETSDAVDQIANDFSAQI